MSNTRNDTINKNEKACKELYSQFETIAFFRCNSSRGSGMPWPEPSIQSLECQEKIFQQQLVQCLKEGPPKPKG